MKGTLGEKFPVHREGNGTIRSTGGGAMPGMPEKSCLFPEENPCTFSSCSGGIISHYCEINRSLAIIYHLL
jgi:hypothetical protein